MGYGYGINDSEPHATDHDQLFRAFMMWASHHQAFLGEDGVQVTYADLGYELQSPDDVFQLKSRSSASKLSMAVYLQSRFVADTVFLVVPASHHGTIQRKLGITFHYRRGPIIMVLRKKKER
ncbi:MAG: hypothetical protein H6773_00560 [Pseudomonadales bacterium]|nr:hypothetical protein [Pseudomonadales bacterium]